MAEQDRKVEITDLEADEVKGGTEALQQLQQQMNAAQELRPQAMQQMFQMATQLNQGSVSKPIQNIR